jgi:hypothetical protein
VIGANGNAFLRLYVEGGSEDGIAKLIARTFLHGAIGSLQSSVSHVLLAPTLQLGLNLLHEDLDVHFADPTEKSDRQFILTIVHGNLHLTIIDNESRTMSDMPLFQYQFSKRDGGDDGSEKRVK